MSGLTGLTLKAARDGLRARAFSAAELARAHVAAMERHRDLNAFITETPERALAMADASDARLAAGEGGLLEGVPLAIKDLFCTEGVLTTAGSHILDGFVPPYESTVSRKLWEAGAVCLGKTNLDEFAMGSSNMTSYYGGVRNPWTRAGENAALVPGGSSGGSAAAVAARLCLGATGTDTGGSIRQPAGFCGIAGIKPTYGRCSRWGVVAFASSLDQAGPMARTVEDCALMLQAMAGYDPGDSTSADLPVPDWAGSLTGDVRGLRIGIPKEYAMPRHAGRDRRDLAPGCRLAARPGCGAGRGLAAAHQVRAADLLHHRPGRGVLQPRPLRRHALRPARRGQEPRRDLHEDPCRRLRAGGAAPHPDRHLRAVGGLLRRLLPEGAEGPPPHRRGLRDRLPAGRRDLDPDGTLGVRSAPARRWTTRSPCTSTTCSP